MADRSTRTDRYVVPGLRTPDYQDPPALTPMPEGQTTEPDEVLPASIALGKRLAKGAAIQTAGLPGDIAYLMERGMQPGYGTTKQLEEMPGTSADIARRMDVDPDSPEFAASGFLAPVPPIGKIAALADKIGYLETVIKYLEGVIKSIDNRGWDIKNAIEWKKFEAGMM